ncbi:hypothetical protein U9M48_013555 [Paspalum notatum var. saurae]|uniref:Uncharacterized protein n=1 Tax=Paspalum notatum var. saurae TaxID=547442 RepID=A0AAQ3T0V3_PASNO
MWRSLIGCIGRHKVGYGVTAAEDLGGYGVWCLDLVRDPVRAEHGTPRLASHTMTRVQGRQAGKLGAVLTRSSPSGEGTRSTRGAGACRSQVGSGGACAGGARALSVWAERRGTRNEMAVGNGEKLTGVIVSTGVGEETQIHGEPEVSSRNGDYADEELDERNAVMSSVFARDDWLRRNRSPNVRRS